MTLLSSPISEQDAVAAVTEVLDERAAGGVEVAVGTNLQDLGLDSLELCELFMALEEVAGERLDPTSAGDVALVGDLCNLRTLVAHHG